MTLLIKNIGTLVCDSSRRQILSGEAMNQLEAIRHAWLLIENGVFSDFGTMGTCPDQADDVVDAKGGSVLPSFCDSHTHLVYADSREGEFVDKIRGLSYAEIARRGGGILNSADRLHQLSEDELYRQAYGEATRAEAERLRSLGLAVEYDGSWHITGLLTADQIRSFPAGSEHSFYIDWQVDAELTAEKIIAAEGLDTPD